MQKGSKFETVHGKIVEFFSCVGQNLISFCCSAFPLPWVQQGTLQVRRSAERAMSCPRGAVLPHPCPCPHPIAARKMCQAAGGRRARRGARSCQRVKACSVLELLYVAPCRGRQNSSLLAGCACTASPLLGCWGEQGGFSSPPESSIPVQWGTGKYSLVRPGFCSQSSFDISVAGGLAGLWRGSGERAGGAVRCSPSALEAAALPRGRSRCPSAPCAFAQKTFAVLSL